MGSDRIHGMGFIRVQKKVFSGKVIEETDVTGLQRHSVKKGDYLQDYIFKVKNDSPVCNHAHVPITI